MLAASTQMYTNDTRHHATLRQDEILNITINVLFRIINLATVSTQATFSILLTSYNGSACQCRGANSVDAWYNVTQI